jgi:imidazolonepropionase-like amidohydrolase
MFNGKERVMKKVLRGGTLIDGSGGPANAGADVIIDGNRISAIRPLADLKAATLPDAEVLDVSGKWVLPGLINMHDHLFFREIVGPTRDTRAKGAYTLTFYSLRNALVALSRGWTTIRDMGALGGISLEVRDTIERGDMPGPRIVACGSLVAITGGHAHGMAIEADGADACRRAARLQLKAGADFVKVAASHDPYPMPGVEQTRAEMNLDEIRAVFDEGHNWGKKAACHVMGTRAIKNVLDAGVDIIDHGIYLNDELAERMAREGVVYCPTLSAYCRQTMNPRFGRGQAWADAHAVLVEPNLEAARAAVRAGVALVVGTDSTGLYAEEVEMLREAGLDAMASLLACTANAAKALGREDIGTIAPGKLADIVVLNADPIADPYALEEVELVVKDGVVYRPETLGLIAAGAMPDRRSDRHVDQFGGASRSAAE